MSFLGDVGDMFLGPALDYFGGERQQDYTRQNMEYSQGFNAQQAELARSFNAAEAQKSRDFTAQQAYDQRYFEQYNSDTAVQRRMADLGRAGLNPILAYQQGGASTPAGGIGGAAQASGPAASSGALPGPKYAFGELLNQSRQVSSAVAVNEAEIAKKRAETAEVQARTQTYPVSIERLKQEINESVERIYKLRTDVQVGEATASQIVQNTENLRQLVPHIQASVQQLRSLSNLQDAQVAEVAARIGKTKEETREIAQRVKQNLPELEAMLKQIEFSIRQNEDLPRSEKAGEEWRKDLGGWIAALIRVFNPLQNLLGTLK